MRDRSLAILCGLMALGVTALAGAAEPEGVSFADDLQPVLNSQCVYCHVTGAENGGLNLGRRHSHADLLSPSEGAPLPASRPAMSKAVTWCTSCAAHIWRWAAVAAPCRSMTRRNRSRPNTLKRSSAGSKRAQQITESVSAGRAGRVK